MDNFGSLNEYLVPKNSPAGAMQYSPSSLDFDTNTDRSAIRGVKLKNFSFNSGTGGTITLGGASNGNGVMYVKNAGGTTKVTVDNTGIVITDGNLTFINSTGGTVLDGSGIVSTTSFTTGEVVNSSVRTTTGTSYTDVTGGSLSSFVLSRTVQAMVNIVAQGYNIGWLIDASSMSIACVDNLDGTLVSYPLYIESKLNSVSGTGSPFTSFSYGIDYQTQSLTAIVPLSAGTHNMKLQFRVNGTGTAELNVTQLGYVILGD